MIFHRNLPRILPFLALLVWVHPISADAPATTTGPKVIFIIRHAEKPDSSDDKDLAPRGYQRADALVQAFPKNFSTPDFICATAESKHSDRPRETVTPLAQSLHMKILNQYANAQYAKLAHELLTDQKYSDKTILICWHHESIPDLAKALGAADAPTSWDSSVFDRVWVLHFDAGQVHFENLPEKALPGDSTN